MNEAFRYNPYSLKEVDQRVYQDLSRSGELPATIGPNNVILQINYACYLRCQMCDRHKWISSGAPSENALNTSELDDLMDQLQTLHTRKITLVGTEPVMREDLPQILTDIRTNGIKPELYTAGIKLDDAVIQAVLDTETDVAFSVDGFNKDSHNGIRMPDGTFDAFGRTLQSIHRLRQARDEWGLDANHVRISANFTIQKGNIRDLTAVTAEDIDHIGVDTLRMALVHGTGSYELNHSAFDILKSFIARLENLHPVTEVDLSSAIKYAAHGLIRVEDFDNNVLAPSSYLKTQNHPQCHIGEYSVMIDPQGNVRPCLYLYDDNGPFADTSRDKFIMGNIRSERFADIWEGKKYSEFRKGHFPDMTPGSKCRVCEYMEDFQRMDKAVANPKGIVQIGW